MPKRNLKRKEQKTKKLRITYVNEDIRQFNSLY